MFNLKEIYDFIVGRPEGELARITAYLLAPGLVLILAGAGIYTPGVGLDFGKPMAVSHLHTEVTPSGPLHEKIGVALTVEPIESEYHIPIHGASAMWVSLDAQALRANTQRLFLSPTGLSVKSPLIGVSGTTTVVVQGEPGTQILLPGGLESAEEWQLQSRRSMLLVSSILMACVFAFGMALASGLPPTKSD